MSAVARAVVAPGAVLTERRRLLVVLVPTVVGMLGAIAYHAYQAYVRHRGYPFDTFLYIPDRRFSDLQVVMGGALGGRPSIGSSYPPFAAVVALVYGGIDEVYDPLATAALIATYAGGVGALVWFGLPEWSRRGRAAMAVGLFIAVYPSLFLLDRANLEAVVFVLLVGFYLSLVSGRTMASAVWLGLAAAMKGTPLILLAVLLARRAWKASAVCLGVVAVASLSHSLIFWVDPFTVYDRLRDGVSAYHEQFIVHDQGWAFGSSMLGLVKTIALHTTHIQDNPAIIKPYETASEIATVLLVAYAVFVERILWRRICVLIVGMLLLPGVTADYRLTLLLIPLIGFLREGGSRRFDIAVGLSFAVLLVPKTYGVRLHGTIAEINLNVILNPIAMTVILGAIVFSGLRQRIAESPVAEPALI